MQTYDVKNNKYSYKIKLDTWNAAFGLHKVDNLEPSKYAKKLAYQNAKGEISYDEIEKSLKNYYRAEKNQETKEADIVSLRITELLLRGGFRLSPAALLGIHRHL
ncbi:MAG: antitoxin VbhA family protein [Campylobacteraceae bacterium]|jgi:hypothetical protein|nr:antitoxin VbhA family protein [Campylobacteraceae bacterium]